MEYLQNINGEGETAAGWESQRESWSKLGSNDLNRYIYYIYAYILDDIWLKKKFDEREREGDPDCQERASLSA